MNFQTLKKKYPAYWQAVEEGVLNDMDTMKFAIREEARMIIAHNTAFIATSELHEYLKNQVDKPS